MIRSSKVAVTASREGKRHQKQTMKTRKEKLIPKEKSNEAITLEINEHEK